VSGVTDEQQMDFGQTESQRELAALARQILTDHVTPTRLREVDQSGVHVDRDLWQRLVSAGVVGAALPERIGGGGLDLLEMCSVLIELGRVVAPVPYLGHVVGTAAVGWFGTDEQRDEFARPAVAGELLLTLALAEDLGTPEAPTTRAVPVEGGWQLTGSKAVVPAGTVADVFVVPARTDAGVGVFIVRRDDEGVGVTPQRLTDGDAGATLDLAGVRLPAGRLVPGADTAHWIVARATIGTCAHQAGVLERALELTAEYARTREQFGRPIGSFQAVAQRLADAYIDVEAVRLTMWEAAWRAAQPLPCPTEIATAKFWAAEAGHRVAHTAVHVHGGMGIDVDGPLHRYFVAAKLNEFSLGGATAQLRAIGAELAATPA
jgi:acyl-CoA dehydrogenase